MHTYRELYFFLFNALTDALEELERGRIVIAIHQMKQAQQTAEERHMETDILPDE